MSAFSRPSVPSPLSEFSYQTTHGTASLAPVNAMSAWIPSRDGSTFNDGSSCPAVGPATRSIPTCWKQKLPTLVVPCAGLVPAGHTPPDAGTACETKIWKVELAGSFGLVGSPLAPIVVPLSASCQVSHGAGLAPGVVVPPISDGASASRPVLMFNDGAVPGTCWPSCTH